MSTWFRHIDAPIRRGVQGALLALGAPLGWYVCQLIAGAHPSHIPTQWPIYLYLTIGTLLAFAGFGWALGRREQRLETLNHELEQRSITDELTGLRNSRYFWKRATDAIDHARRTDEPMAMILIDLDHFTDVNDTFGHSVGDEVLERLGAIIDDSVRGADVTARVGGEEFALLLDNSSPDDAFDVAERLRRRIDQTDFISDDVTTLDTATGSGTHESIDVTASLGVAAARGAQLGDAEDLFRAADRALYAAKHAGRNQTARADHLPNTAPTYGT